MYCAYYNKYKAGSWRLEPALKQCSLNVAKISPKKKAVDTQLTSKHILFKHKQQLEHPQLAKLVLPKNAVEVLRQFKGLEIDKCCFENNPDGTFLVNVNINSKLYTAKGNSKREAKTLAAEFALHDYITTRLMSLEGETLDAENTMFNLASFAIYKLHEEWMRDGYIFKPLEITTPTAELDEVLPPNWKDMHPCSLLLRMRPEAVFSSVPSLPNAVQTAKVIVGDQEFVACGRSKKIARRNVAITACNALFDAEFNKS